jgi:hypothetical protein
MKIIVGGESVKKVNKTQIPPPTCPCYNPCLERDLYA